jgi:CheY-like chemotaxis protein
VKPRLQVGHLLVASGALQDADVARVLDAQRSRRTRFCTTALELGLATERDLVAALSRQLGVPGMVVSDVRPESAGARLVPREAADKLGVLPARVFNRTLTLLMTDPTDQDAVNELQFYSGKVIRPLVALEGPLRAELEAFYGRVAARAAGSMPSRPSGPLTPVRTPIDAGAVVPVAPLPPEALLPSNMVAPASETQTADLDPAGSIEDQIGVEPLDSAMSLEDLDSSMSASVDDDRPRILAVDDEPAILKLYEGMFPPDRYQLSTCDNGADALDKVRAVRPHLILLDSLLPGMHGFEICRRVKHNEALQNIRVVLLSAAYRGWQMRADLTRQYGADDFIEKPFAIVHVLERVEELLEGARGGARRTRGLQTEALKHMNSGLMLFQQGELEGAQAAFERAAGADAFAARPHFYLGKIHERRDEPFDAMFAYEQAVGLDPTFFPAVKDLAILYQRHGFLNKAVEMWQKALANCPEPSMRDAIKEHLLKLI